MKELPFQRQGLLPLTSNVRILKLWNSTVCSVHSGLPPDCDTVSCGGGFSGTRRFRLSRERGNQAASLFFKNLGLHKKEGTWYIVSK